MKNKKIAVIGLGYVGLPVAAAFAEQGFNVTGFDVDAQKITLYQSGIDPTGEVGHETLKKLQTLCFSSNPKDIQNVDFIIVTVPTPVFDDHTPDLRPIESATKIIGKNLKKNAIIIYESTVYPGFTEEFCVPLLEAESSMKCGHDFKIGYSPERINPGDKKRRLDNIIKITSGMDKATADMISDLYSTIVNVGVHQVSSIKVAEAAKVIENTQRDVNIAFMNELALIFDKIDIDTNEVLEAAGTKWNFLPFKPGLVGGHCIGVDPYYLAHKAKQMGHKPELILSSRKINDSIGHFIAEKTIEKLAKNSIASKDARIMVMGLTFKENYPDIRNSRVYDIITSLRNHGTEVLATDPFASQNDAKNEYGIDLCKQESISDVDAIIIAVAHDQYRTLSIEGLQKYYRKKGKKYILMDIKSILDRDSLGKEFDYWRL